MCLKYLITLFVSLFLLAACSSELEGIEMWKIPSVDELSSEKGLEPNYLLSSTVGAIYLRLEREAGFSPTAHQQWMREEGVRKL